MLRTGSSQTWPPEKAGKGQRKAGAERRDLTLQGLVGVDGFFPSAGAMRYCHWHDV